MSPIYKVRCTLFHGGKAFTSSSDRRFVQLSYDILSGIWRGP
jgi:hypothetical protein